MLIPVITIDPARNPYLKSFSFLAAAFSKIRILSHFASNSWRARSKLVFVDRSSKLNLLQFKLIFGTVGRIGRVMILYFFTFYRLGLQSQFWYSHSLLDQKPVKKRQEKRITWMEKPNSTIQNTLHVEKFISVTQNNKTNWDLWYKYRVGLTKIYNQLWCEIVEITKR
jgi:hypothetical protein